MVDDDVHHTRLQWRWLDRCEHGADVDCIIAPVRGGRWRLGGISVLRHERDTTDVPWRVSYGRERLLEPQSCVCESIWCLRHDWAIVVDDLHMWAVVGGALARVVARACAVALALP